MAPVQCQFLWVIQNQAIFERARKKVIYMQIFRKSLRMGQGDPEINDSEDRCDRRSLRLRAERDFDRKQKSKFD